MINTTEKLIKYLNQPEKNSDEIIISSYVYSILNCGSKSDAEVILNYFVSQSIDCSNESLLPIFEKWGDFDIGQKIFNAKIKDNRLVNEDYPQVLELLGTLKFEPIKPTLIHYAFNEESDHYLHKSAVLGLLNFNCDDIEAIILSKIEETYQQHLFPEFTPALVCKLKNKKEVLERLYESGKDYCSTDCNAGIILGFSLCGEEGRPYFNDILFIRVWEAYSSATGTVHFTYQGLKNLNISLITLYQEIKQTEDLEKQETGLVLIIELIKLKINDYSNIEIESFADLYSRLFSWENGSILELAQKFKLEEKVYHLRDLIILKINEEIILCR